MSVLRISALMLAPALVVAGTPDAFAQDGDRRVRVGLGPKIGPAYPGADNFVVGPYIEFSTATADQDFVFEAPDESFDFALLNTESIQAGPVATLQRARTAERVGTEVAKVDRTLELGGFVQVAVTPAARLRFEARRGIGGHDGWVFDLGGDYVWRERDERLFSIGPRVTFSNETYQNAYFGVTPADTARTGLATFRPEGGIQSVGVTASHLRQLNANWGIAGFARYDRLVGDAARSPIVREYGSRNQLTAGLALTYTFLWRR